MQFATAPNIGMAGRDPATSCKFTEIPGSSPGMTILGGI